MKHYLIYCQGDILLTKEGNIPFGNNPPVELKEWNQITTILINGEEYCIYKVDLPIEKDEVRMYPLRKTFSILSEEDYGIAGKGAELVYWDSNTKYCGLCGSPTKWMTEISKKCTECGKEWWPSPATAIIVRIQKEDKILLVHAKSFRSNHYGLVAGFLETGETLEQCVRREVWEETHIKIKNIEYFGSQAWPYPNGMMVGFTADYDCGDIILQKAELSDGGWYTKDNLPQIPDKASIARRLIDDWIIKQIP